MTGGRCVSASRGIGRFSKAAFTRAEVVAQAARADLERRLEDEDGGAGVVEARQEVVLLVRDAVRLGRLRGQTRGEIGDVSGEGSHTPSDAV